MSPSFQFHFTSADGLSIACTRWDSRGESRGVVQIAHGMGEHIGRYSELIQVLVAAGLTVYGNDHRGHGRSVPPGKPFGDFGDGGFDLLVEDMLSLTRIIKHECPFQPVILLAHSMGSFAAQQYVLDYSGEIDGLVLSGSGALDGLARLAASAPKDSNILNRSFEPARVPFDWLSRDPAVVDAFMNDRLCFASLQPAAFASFLGAAPQMCNPARIRKIRSELPVYVFSGSEDPVGQRLEGVRLLLDRYQRAGLRDLAHTFYPGGRHEMLNEINREEVWARLLAWINAVLERRAMNQIRALRTLRPAKRQQLVTM
jgi:alpha-beta hydrolase superfamily lysophospholipase